MRIDWRGSVALTVLLVGFVALAAVPADPVRELGRLIPQGLRPAGSGSPDWQAIGSSVRGRPIHAARFGDGDYKVLYVGGVHGNEYGADVAEQLAAYLAQNPDAVPPGVRYDVIACLNPDGRAAGTGPNANRVNLNRNLPTRNWAPRPPDAWGAGARPGSEPETQVLVEYLRERFDVVVSLHSTGPLIDPDGPGAAAIARRMSEISGISVGEVRSRRPMTGSLGVYVPERYGRPVVTVELASPTMDAGLRDALLSGVLRVDFRGVGKTSARTLGT